MLVLRPDLVHEATDSSRARYSFAEAPSPNMPSPRRPGYVGTTSMADRPSRGHEPVLIARRWRLLTALDAGSAGRPGARRSSRSVLPYLFGPIAVSARPSGRAFGPADPGRPMRHDET